MVLLFKKEDPELLKNWRPLSLINSDAKLFTKLLANRLKRVLSQLITPYQTGFMPHRLTSDNAWLNQTLMNNLHAAAPNDPNVAVLLDQEKAYDRVNPTYLTMVLHQFGFPASLVDSISGLFFDTRISLSINGWLGAPIEQRRGLRQGDSLSPLLFNLAFEPFLRIILACAETDHALLSAPASPPRVKMHSYADDLEVFLASPAEWPVLLSLLSLYGKASNAKVNLEKTVLVSLSGKPHDDWKHLADSSKVVWHDESSTGSVRYLGYPLYHAEEQLAHFLDTIPVKVQRQCNSLTKRQLSIRGKGLVANSLLLSRLWHILRVVVVPSYATALPLLLYRRNYWPRLRKCPHLEHLARLLTRLPPLTPSPKWPSWWLLDLPWLQVCSLSPTATLTRTSDKLPPHRLIASLLSLLPDTNILPCLRPRNTAFLQQMFNALCPFEGSPVWIIPDSLRSVMAFTDQERAAMLESSTTPSL